MLLPTTNNSSVIICIPDQRHLKSEMTCLQKNKNKKKQYSDHFQVRILTTRFSIHTSPLFRQRDCSLTLLSRIFPLISKRKDLGTSCCVLCVNKLRKRKEKSFAIFQSYVAKQT